MKYFFLPTTFFSPWFVLCKIVFYHLLLTLPTSMGDNFSPLCNIFFKLFSAFPLFFQLLPNCLQQYPTPLHLQTPEMTQIKTNKH